MLIEYLTQKFLFSFFLKTLNKKRQNYDIPQKQYAGTST